MLSDDQADKVRLTLSTLGWNEVIEPAVRARGNEALKALALSKNERTERYKGTELDTDDDVLRAIIKDCAWLASIWRIELQANEHNRQLDEADRLGQPAG